MYNYNNNTALYVPVRACVCACVCAYVCMIILESLLSDFVLVSSDHVIICHKCK